MRKKFTPGLLDQKPPATGRVEVRDTISPLIFRVTSKGGRTFTVRVRVRGEAQPIRLTFAKPPHTDTLAEARSWAVETVSKCGQGIDPRAELRAAEAAAAAAKVASVQGRFDEVVKAFLATNGAFKKNARPWKPRTLDEYKRCLRRAPADWAERGIATITRDEIADFVADLAEATPVAANRTLAVLSTMMGWYQAKRGSNFTSPIARGMAPAEEQTRDRILSDDELRLIWRVASRSGAYGAFIRTLLLTAARRQELANMRRSAIMDGVWRLPGDMTKNHEPLELPLSAAALQLIAAQPIVDDRDLVFFNAPMQAWSRLKQEFDARCFATLRAVARRAGKNPGEVKPLPNWTIHDLRRTARSLMSRAGVQSDHAERVLNHRLAGIVGVYDRHRYEAEKGRALEALATLLDRIVHPPADNVVALRTAAE